MNSRSSFKNHTQFQTLPLTSDPRANPNNPPTPPPPTPPQKTSILSLKNNLVIVNIMHSKQLFGFVRSEMVTWSDIHPF